MTTHHLTITLPDGKNARGQRRCRCAARRGVVYLQPKAERSREQVAAPKGPPHILCSEWLDPYWYGALYD